MCRSLKRLFTRRIVPNGKRWGGRARKHTGLTGALTALRGGARVKRENSILETQLAIQEARRTDIRALREEIEFLRKRQDASFDILTELARAEERRTSIAEDVTQIANSITGLVEDMHRENRAKNRLIEGLTMRLKSDAAMDHMIAQLKGVGLAIGERGI